MAEAHITMWSYLWDFAYDGMDDVLREMKEIGLNALSVATSYHTVEHLRPHGKGPFIYRSKGAVYFQPDMRLYGKTDIRPQVSPLVEKENLLKRLCDRAAARGLDVVSWTVCCHNSWLGERHPYYTLHNAFGDSYPEALCPANPDVREYLKAMVADLTTNYRIAVAELEACHYAAKRHYHHHEKIGIEFGEVDTFLLALCFCPHCETRGQKANVDTARVRALAAETLRRTFATGEPRPGTVQDFIGRSNDLERYVQMRIETVSSLHREIHAAAKVDVSAMSWAPPETCGLDPREVSHIADSITILAYSPDVNEVRKTIEDAAKAVGGARRLRVGYHTYPPNTPDKETLLRNIQASLDLGVRAFSFYNYGIMPRRSLAWTKEAVRLIREA